MVKWVGSIYDSVEVMERFAAKRMEVSVWED